MTSKNNTNFEKWFHKNIKIRSYPNLLDLSNKYIIGDVDIVINVSDIMKPDIYTKIKEKGIEYFWFPMNESSKDIGINSIFGACTILFNAEKENKNVLLHCKGGNNRSQTLAQAYYFLRTQKHIITDYKDFDNQLIYNAENEHLPAIEKMEMFLTELYLKLKTEQKGGELDDLKIKIINS